MSKNNDENTQAIIAEGLAATRSARISADIAAEHYDIPQDYTGNRTLYDSGTAKYHAKSQLFSGNPQVRDPYTGDILTLTKAEAKSRFGAEWQKHLAESDHIHLSGNCWE